MAKTIQKGNSTSGNKMTEIDNIKLILQIINSIKFRENLIKINSSYSNLKQEGLIRSLILEELNSHFCSINRSSLKAFAEHPRIEGTRIDLSIVDSFNIEKPFKIEFKYQFSKDSNCLKDYWKVINKDFEVRNSDLFILIICDWNIKEKKEYDKKWGITSNLSRYIAKNMEWKENIIESFKRFNKAQLIECEKIAITEPYKTEYYFYMLSR